MTSSFDTIPTGKTAAPPFRWLNPYRPTAFRVMVGLGIGAMILLMSNLFTIGGLDSSAWLWSAAAAAIVYVLAEFLLVTIIVAGPFAAFVYGVIAWLMH